MDQAANRRETSDANADLLEGIIPEPEFARCVGWTVRSCQRHRRMRTAPPHIKLGRKIYYRVEAVREWLVKNERRG